MTSSTANAGRASLPAFRAGPEEAARIARAFDETFERWEIALPREAVERGEPWLIRRAGWTINAYLRTEGPPDE
jgi:hypothetical protein